MKLLSNSNVYKQTGLDIPWKLLLNTVIIFIQNPMYGVVPWDEKYLINKDLSE